nr:transposase [Epibacterium ulvae]
MAAISAFLANVPRRSDGKPKGPTDLKARIVAETLIERETVNAVATRYELIPSTVSDWRRIARQGKLVLPNLDGMDFVPVEVETSPPLAQPLPAASAITIDVIRRDVTVRLDAATPASRIAELARAMNKFSCHPTRSESLWPVIRWAFVKAMMGLRLWCRVTCSRSRLMGPFMCSGPSAQADLLGRQRARDGIQAA